MKTIVEYIKEELSDNLFWKLSKWFERNEKQENEFINIIMSCETNGLNQKQIETELENTSLYKDLREFVNFIYDDLDINKEKDYLYNFKKIIESIINNNSKENKYISI